RAETILLNYSSLCKEYSVDVSNAIATSAVRDAKNKHDVLSRLGKALDAPVYCISGKEEAQLCFHGTAQADNECILDIGGGSTELVFRNDSGDIQSLSINVGAVRLTERYFSDGVTDTNIESAQRDIIEAITHITLPELSMLRAVAGTPTTLAAMTLDLAEFDAQQIDGFALTLNTVSNHRQWLMQHHGTEVLRSRNGIHPDRADILFAGTLILETILKHFSISECTVSVRGVRYGLAIRSAEAIQLRQLHR
ncbi:MAG: hypothetical protein JNL32_16575, partial [Candidatus Kapabacteria bacterium]|nr:hypothetical protein [Candidatus Kapabacteria bacterium]